MSEQYDFFKRVVRCILDDSKVLTLRNLPESWTYQMNLVGIFFIVFIGISFEIILIKLWRGFQRKLSTPKQRRPNSQESKENYLQREIFDNLSSSSSSKGRDKDQERKKQKEKERRYNTLCSWGFDHGSLNMVRNVDFSEIITSSFTSEENESSFEGSVPSDEMTWISTSKSKWYISQARENRTLSSSSGTSSSLSLIRTDVKEVFLSPSRRSSESDQEKMHFSSKKLFSIMKTNKDKMLTFPSDFNLTKNSKVMVENECLDGAPCPHSHLFLSRDQLKLLEENVRNQIPLKSKTKEKSESPYMNSVSREVLVQNQHSMKKGIPAPKQNYFQSFCEAELTSQAPQYVQSQESTNQIDTEASHFALPHDVMKSFSSSTLKSFQARNVGRTPHLVKVPCSVESQDLIEDFPYDKKFLDEYQRSVWLGIPKESKYLTKGQNVFSENTRSLSSNSVANRIPQNSSSKLCHCSAYDSVYLLTAIKRQKNRRETLHSKNKFSLEVLSRKSKSLHLCILQWLTGCHISKYGHLGYGHNTEEKKELYQRILVNVLNLISVSKFVFPDAKKNSRKRLVNFTPGSQVCGHFLQSQIKSLDQKKVGCAGVGEIRGASDSSNNVKVHSREDTGLKHTLSNILPQPEQSFTVNIYHTPSSSPIERNRKYKESLKYPVTQAKEVDTIGFCTSDSKESNVQSIPEHHISLGEAIVEPRQKFVFSSQLKSNGRLEIEGDLSGMENSHLIFSNGKKLSIHPPEMQKSSPQSHPQNQKDCLKIILESSDVSLFISLGNKKQESHEQLGDTKVQKSTENIFLKEEKPLIIRITNYDGQSLNDRLECNTRGDTEIMQGERLSDVFPSAIDATASEPQAIEMYSRLKTKTLQETDVSRKLGHSHSSVKQEELPDEKKIWTSNCKERQHTFAKPQEQLTQNFTHSMELQPKSTCVKLEREQSNPGERGTQNKVQEVQPQTLSTQTTLVSPFQGMEVKRSTNRVIGRESADPENSFPVMEKQVIGDISTETTDCNAPLDGDLRKIPGEPITEDNKVVKTASPAVSLESSMLSMLPSSDVKKRNREEQVPSSKLHSHTIMEEKQSTASPMLYNNRHDAVRHKNRLKGDSEVIMKQTISDKNVTGLPVNVNDPHSSVLLCARTPTSFSAEDDSHTKLTQEGSQTEKAEEGSDIIYKGKNSGSTPETTLQTELREHKDPQVNLQGSWEYKADTYPKKTPKTEKDTHRPIPSTQSAVESTYSPQVSSSQDGHLQTSMITQLGSVSTTGPEVAPSTTTAKSLTEDLLNGTREDDAPVCGSDTKEIAYCFAETKTELLGVKPAVTPETLRSCLAVLSNPKTKKNRVRFLLTDCTVESKSVHLSTAKSSEAQTFHTTDGGEQEKFSLKTNQIDMLAYEFLNALYSPGYSKLQGHTGMSCHAQLRQGEVRDGRRPRYLDFITRGSAFYCEEEKVQNKEEQEPNTQIHPAAEQAQCLPFDGSQSIESHLSKTDSTLGCLTQEQSGNEQDMQSQTCFALETDLQASPRKVETLQKATQTENHLTDPIESKIPPPELESALPDELWRGTTECDLMSPDGEHERERDSPFMGEDSELSKDSQMPFLQPLDFAEHCTSNSERKRSMLNSLQEQMAMLDIRSEPKTKHGKGLRSSFATQTKAVSLGKNVASKVHFFMTSAFDISVYRETVREKDKIGEEKPSSQHVKEMVTRHEKIISEDIREISFQNDKVSDQEMSLEDILHHSQRFVFCSGQRKKPDFQKSENQGRRKTVFVTEQDYPHHTQPMGPRQAEELKTSHQHDKKHLVCSNLPLLKSKELLMGPISIDRMKSSPLGDRSPIWKQNSYAKNEKTEFNKDLQTSDLESPDVSRPDLAEFKRQRKTFTSRAFKNNRRHKSIKMKAKAAPISQIFNISGNSCPKKMPWKVMKLQTSDILDHMKYFDLLDVLTIQVKKDLVQKLSAPIVDSFDITLFPLSASKRKQQKFTNKRTKKSPAHKTMQGKKTPVSQTSSTIKHGLSSHRKKFEYNFKTMRRQGQTMANVILDVISSSVPVSPDIKVYSNIKVEMDMMWQKTFSQEWQKSDREKVWDVNLKTHKMKTPQWLKSDLELKNTRKQSPQSLATLQEQQTMVTQKLVHSVSCYIVNSLMMANQQKRVKTPRDSKGRETSNILPSGLQNSSSESLVTVAQNNCPSERKLQKKLAGPLPGGKIRLQRNVHMKTLKSLDFFGPTSSKFKKQRKATQLPQSITGKAEISYLKTINDIRPGVLTHREDQDDILENLSKEVSQGLSDNHVDNLSLIPLPLAIKNHMKVKARSGAFRKRSHEMQLELHENNTLYNYSSTKLSISSNTSESRSQTDEGSGLLCKAGREFLRTTGSTEGQQRLTMEPKIQQQTRASEEVLDSVSSLLIPFQDEKLVIIPSQKDIPQRIGGKFLCPESMNIEFDDPSTDETQYEAICEKEFKKQLGAPSAVSQQHEVGENIKSQKALTCLVSQDIIPATPKSSVFADPYEESSRERVSNDIAKKHREWQRYLITIFMMSALLASKRQKRALTFPERRAILGPKHKTTKAKKSLFSQKLNIPEPGNQSCRKEEECNFKSMIKYMKQNKSLENVFSSPTLTSSYKKIDLENHCTPKTEMGKSRLKAYWCAYPEVEKSSSSGRETWKTGSTNIPTTLSNTMKWNLQPDKEEKYIPRSLLESISLCGQQFTVSGQPKKVLKASKSKLKPRSSEGRKTWDSPWMIQDIQNVILESAAREVLNFLQIEAAEEGPLVEEREELVTVGKEEFSLGQHTTQDRNFSMKWDSLIFEEKAQDQNAWVRAIIKTSDLPSFDSSEPPNQGNALMSVSKKNTMSSKQTALKAMELPTSQLLDITRCLGKRHRKKKHNLKSKMKEWQWNGSVRETLFYDSEEARIPTPGRVTDEFSFHTTGGGAHDNTLLHKNLGSCTTEEKVELGENLATTFLEPLDFFVPILSAVCSSPQKMQVDPLTQETKTEVMEAFRLESFPWSKTSLFQIGKQKTELKNANWETVVNPTIQIAKREKPLTQVQLSNTIQVVDSQHQREGKEPENRGVSSEVWSLMLGKASHKTASPVVQPPQAGVDSLIPGKREQQERHTHEIHSDPASSPQTDLHQVNITEQHIQLESTDIILSEHSTPEAGEALKGIDVVLGYPQKSNDREHLQEQYLFVPSEHYREHMSFPPQYPWFPQLLMPQTKYTLSEESNVLRRTEGSDSFSTAQANFLCDCVPEWGVHRDPSKQGISQNAILSSDSCIETAEHLSVSFPAAVGIYNESTDGILGSSGRAKNTPWRNETQVETTLKETKHPTSNASNVGQPVGQEPQLNVKDKKTQEDKNKAFRIQSKSYTFTSLPPHSGVAGKMKEVGQTQREPSFFTLTLRESLDRKNRASKKSGSGVIIKSRKNIKDHVIKKDKKVKMTKSLPLREMKPASSQKILLDMKEQGGKIEDPKGKPSVVLTRTSTSTADPSHSKLGRRIRNIDFDIITYLLPKQACKTSADTVKKTQGASSAVDVCKLKKEGAAPVTSVEDYNHAMHLRTKGLEAFSQSLKEPASRYSLGGKEGRTDEQCEGKQEVIPPIHWPSGFHLIYHDSDMKIGKGNRHGVAGPACSGSRLPASSDGKKAAGRKSMHVKFSDVNTVQEHKSLHGAEGEVRDGKYTPCPQSVTAKAEALYLPKVLSTSNGYDPQMRETQMKDTRDRCEHVQDRQNDRDKVLATPFLPPIPNSKGRGGGAKAFLLPSWYTQSPETENLRFINELPLKETTHTARTEDVKNKEVKMQAFKRDRKNPKCATPKTKKSPLLNILQATEVQVNIKEVKKGNLETNREGIMILCSMVSSEPCNQLTSTACPKLDKEEGLGAGRTKSHLEHSQEILPSWKTLTESAKCHVKRREQDLPEKGKAGGQIMVMNSSLRPWRGDLKAKTPPSPLGFCDPKYCTLSKRQKPQGSTEEETEQRQRRTDPDMALTKSLPPLPHTPHPSLETRPKGDKRVLSKAQLKLPSMPHSGILKKIDFSGYIRSCDVKTKTKRCAPYEKAKSAVKIDEDIKKQVEKVQEDKIRQEMAFRDSSLFIPPPPLKWDTRVRGRKDTPGISQTYFIPAEIQRPLDSDKELCTKSASRCLLKGKDRIKTRMEDTMLYEHMNPKAKELLLRHILDRGKLKWKIKEQERKIQEDKYDIDLKNVCNSVFTLPYFKFDTTEEEARMVRITKWPLPQQSQKPPDTAKLGQPETISSKISNYAKKSKEHMQQRQEKEPGENPSRDDTVSTSGTDLKAKKSPVLLTSSWNGLCWKIEEQENEVQGNKNELDGIVLASTCRSSLPHNVNTGNEDEESKQTLASSCLSQVHLQESSDLGEVVHVESVIEAILVSSQSLTASMMPQAKEEDEVEGTNLMLSRHKEKKMQESTSKLCVDLTQPCPSFSSSPPPMLGKERQVHGEMLDLECSALQRTTNVGEVMPPESVWSDSMKSGHSEKQHALQREDGDKEIMARGGWMHPIRITTKSKKSVPSYIRYRSEVHLNIGEQAQKGLGGQGKPLDRVLRKTCDSKSPAHLGLDKGTQVGKEALGIQRSSLPPLMLSALTDEKIRAQEAVTVGAGGGGRKSDQQLSQKEKKCDMRMVDLRIKVRHKEARALPVSHILQTKGFVLNIREIRESKHRGKTEPCIVLTRTFFSIPEELPLYLDLGSETDKKGMTRSLHPQQNLQKSLATVTGELTSGSELMAKETELSVTEKEAAQSWTSDFIIRVHQRQSSSWVKPEGDLKQSVLNSHDNICFTGFGTIRSDKRLECLFTAQKHKAKKGKMGTLPICHPYSMAEATKLENPKKETKMTSNLGHKRDPKVLAPLPRKISSGVHDTTGTSASKKELLVSKSDAPQETLSKTPPGSKGVHKFAHPNKDMHTNNKIRKMFTPQPLASQTREPLQKTNTTEANTSQNMEEPIVLLKRQMMLPSDQALRTKLDSNVSLQFPLQSREQKMLLETDAYRQAMLFPGIHILPGMHIEYEAVLNKKEHQMFVPGKERYILEPLQKSLPCCWSLSLQTTGIQGGNERNTRPTINMQHRKLEMEEGKLKVDTNTVHQQENKIERHKHNTVSTGKKVNTGKNSPASQNAPSLKAEKSQALSHMIVAKAMGCPTEEKHKKSREASSAKQSTQSQDSLLKHVMGSFYAYIPFPSKAGGQKGRLAITGLNRELNPKYLTVKIPNHSVKQLFDCMELGTPSNRKKLGFSKPNEMVLWRKDVPQVSIRHLSISIRGLPQTGDTVKSENNAGGKKRFSHSELQKSKVGEIVHGSSASPLKDQSLTDTVPPDSQTLMVHKQQMSSISGAPSESNLCGEVEKVPKPMLAPTVCPSMSGEPQEYVESHTESIPKETISSAAEFWDDSKLREDPTSQKAERQKPSSDSVLAPPHNTSSESEVVAATPSAEESLRPLFEAIKSIFESQLKNMIQGKVYTDLLEVIRAHKDEAWKPPPSEVGLDAMISWHPESRSEHFMFKEEVKLKSHLESKALEIQLNLPPEMVQRSSPKSHFCTEGETIVENQHVGRYPRHKKVCRVTIEDAETIELNLQHKCQQASSPENVIIRVSRGREKMTAKIKGISKLESGPCEAVLPHILQNYSTKEKDKFLTHLSMKVTEIQMGSFPRTVRESYAKVTGQNGKKLFSQCTYPTVRTSKGKNRSVLPLDEKSLHQTDSELQCKYSRFRPGFPSKRMFHKPNMLPKHSRRLKTAGIRKKGSSVKGSDLSTHTAQVEKHIPFKIQSLYKSSSVIKSVPEPSPECVSDPGQEGTVQQRTGILTDVKPPVTPEKEKQCHVWFQETNIHQFCDSQTRIQTTDKNTEDSHSTLSTGDCLHSHTEIENSSGQDGYPPPEEHSSEECVFLELKPHLGEESENILYELQTGVPLENLYKVTEVKTNSKPIHGDTPGSQHYRDCKKHSLLVTSPPAEPHKNKTCKSSFTRWSPDRGSHSSFNTVHVSSGLSSILSNDDGLLGTTQSTRIVPLTESNIKLHLAKSQGRPHRHAESKTRKKAKLDVSRKNSSHWNYDRSQVSSKDKSIRIKTVHGPESGKSDYSTSNCNSTSKSNQEDVSCLDEGKLSQPFFYACIPADSLEIIPQTVRWVIPQKTLRKRNFRVPVVAKISSSCNIWSSPKKLLESVMETFSRVHRH